MLNENEILELNTKGYIRIPNFLSKSEIEFMLEAMVFYRDKYHTQANIRNRIAYLSDTSETRISNAFMVSTGDSPLPHISVYGSVLGNIIDDYQTIMRQLSPVFSDPRDTRLMMNMQEYKEASKPIPWHFDGEYLDCNSESTDGSIQVVEGLIPRYVAVYTLYNKNDFGTSVKNLHTGNEFSVESEAGDLFIFDNITHHHSVPELKKDRAMFGFRNFDHNPYHFSQDYSMGSTVVSNDCFNGYAHRITTKQAQEMHKDFIVKWKDNYNKDLKAKF